MSAFESVSNFIGSVRCAHNFRSDCRAHSARYALTRHDSQLTNAFKCASWIVDQAAAETRCWV